MTISRAGKGEEGEGGKRGRVGNLANFLESLHFRNSVAHNNTGFTCKCTVHP